MNEQVRSQSTRLGCGSIMMASVRSGHSIGRSKQGLFTNCDTDLDQSKSRNGKFSITALTLSTCTGKPAG